MRFPLSILYLTIALGLFAPFPYGFVSMVAAASCQEHNPDMWHGATGPNGCTYGHEHGDAPQTWIATSDFPLMFHGDFSTSPAENTTKHPVMKGFSATINDLNNHPVDIYMRVHAGSNPLDRCSRFHSFEFFARDYQGGISHMSGWADAGDPTTSQGRFLRRLNTPVTDRPSIWVVDEMSAAQGLGAEQWYLQTAWFLPVYGWNIVTPTTYYRRNECDNVDMSTWILRGIKFTGASRRLEISWPNALAYYQYIPRDVAFYSDQFGNIFSVDPNDSRCSGTVVKFNKTYNVQCQRQYIASGLGKITYQSSGTNARQKDYQDTGVVVPN